MSPMKWIMLNILTQSSILQTISFMSMKKIFNLSENHSILQIYKLYWKW